MKRAPIVLSGTALGLVGVLGYHAAAATTTATTARVATSATRTSTPATTTASASTTRTTTAATTKVRTATGEDVSYRYGDLQVKVTMSGSRVTDVQVVALNVTDPHSAQIDQDAVPQLRQEAVAASSAKIDGVSGASYTSQAYEQSLQSAIDKLASTGSSA